MKADFNSAIDDYSSGNYESAFDQFMSMASVGEKRSQFNLGVMYYQGQHVPKNIDKAYAWLRLATEGETFVKSEKDIFEIVEAEIKNLVPAEREYQIISKQYATKVIMEKLYPRFVQPVKGNSFLAIPVDIVQPKYPKKAAMYRIQGWTRFRFDLDANGVPRNIQLVEALPKNTFEKVSRKAISKWRFLAALDKNGNPAPQQNLLYTMQFRLKGVPPIALKDGLYEKNMVLAKKGDLQAQYNIGFWEKKLNVSKGQENPSEWFFKAAVQGHPHAQFELGKSLIFGKGCIQDRTKGVEWLTRSAYSGQAEAKQLLAIVASKVKTLSSHKEAIAFLTSVDVKHLSATTKLNYAWLLATSPFEEVADPEKSLDIVDSMSWSTFNDDITLYEIRAAAYAAMGKFKKARSYQEDALEEAEDREADLTDIKNHLASYQKDETWF